MASLNGFNANNHQPKDFSPLPAGEYQVVIVSSDRKRNSANTGSYLKFEFDVVDGPGKGRKLWVNLNDENPSQEAVKIAMGELSAICRAVGVLTPNDTVELHNIPLTVKVGIRKNKQSNEEENHIKGYVPRGGASSSPTPSGASQGKPAWMNRT